ncbi:hypothetical protein N7478_007206 [Penicillium angulare]|uniref:uncharacterized protein n=1 Tax=Penicillium angulare TaxID=116970 RepID=UPI0025419E5A|nr:uncharacterized protein N7478_007206 [Penicillium angulare]KAJ5281834.1 hypothetical protein N7478_007206 [Penicillium angulare]
MGLWTMQDDKSQEVARELHETLCAAIYDQREKWDISDQDGSETQLHEILSPGPTSWPMATYQGILIQLIFSILTNESRNIQMTHDLPEVPSQLLVGLVRTCLKRNLFHYPSILAHFKTQTGSEESTWLVIEGVKRFNLSLYKVCQNVLVTDLSLLDDSFDCETRRGRRSPGERLLSLADLQFALPGDDEIWESLSSSASNEGGLKGYKDQNIEQLWLSQAAKIMQPRDQRFQWI